jgi:hypothetical protein
MATKFLFFRQSFYSLLLLFLHHFFLSIDICNALRITRSLCNDICRRTQGNTILLTLWSIFILPWLTFTFAPLLLFSQYTERDENGYRLHGTSTECTRTHSGIGLKGSRKNGETFSIFFFRCTHFSMIYCVVIAPLNNTTCLPFWTLPLSLLALLASSPLLHSVGLYTRLVVLWQVLHIA